MKLDEAKNNIIEGDTIEVLKKLPDNSIDAIVTDPPYGLEFMGKEWDKFGAGVVAFSNKEKGGLGGYKTHVRFGKKLYSYQKFSYAWAKECFRVLKPGGFLLSFGGTRTYHRMACGIEDAGFEIRDTIMWLYGSGFPKSLNISKNMEKKGIKGSKQWEGWGTALKPAHEPIVVARKPLSEKNVALNVLKWGTGGLNIDGTRIPFENTPNPATNPKYRKEGGYKLPARGQESKGAVKFKSSLNEINTEGRFPANIILDEESARMLDEQSGNVNQGHWSKTKTTGFGKFGGGKSEYNGVGEKDKTKHGASRFFYVAKASKSERNLGLEEKKNVHPTVKPVKLMRYLVKLVCRKGGIVLDPFMGSGTTAIACVLEGMDYIGIEKEKEYIDIAEARIKYWKGKVNKRLDEFGGNNENT